jgi:hypothetical protein
VVRLTSSCGLQVPGGVTAATGGSQTNRKLPGYLRHCMFFSLMQAVHSGQSYVLPSIHMSPRLHLYASGPVHHRERATFHTLDGGLSYTHPQMSDTPRIESGFFKSPRGGVSLLIVLVLVISMRLASHSIPHGISTGTRLGTTL